MVAVGIVGLIQVGDIGALIDISCYLSTDLSVSDLSITTKRLVIDTQINHWSNIEPVFQLIRRLFKPASDVSCYCAVSNAKVIDWTIVISPGYRIMVEI